MINKILQFLGNRCQGINKAVFGTLEGLLLSMVNNTQSPLKLRAQFLDGPHVIAYQTFAGRVAGELHTIKTGGSYYPCITARLQN